MQAPHVAVPMHLSSSAKCSLPLLPARQRRLCSQACRQQRHSQCAACGQPMDTHFRVALRPGQQAWGHGLHRGSWRVWGRPCAPVSAKKRSKASQDPPVRIGSDDADADTGGGESMADYLQFARLIGDTPAEAARNLQAMPVRRDEGAKAYLASWTEAERAEQKLLQSLRSRGEPTAPSAAEYQRRSKRLSVKATKPKRSLGGLDGLYDLVDSVPSARQAADEATRPSASKYESLAKRPPAPKPRGDQPVLQGKPAPASWMTSGAWFAEGIEVGSYAYDSAHDSATQQDYADFDYPDVSYERFEALIGGPGAPPARKPGKPIPAPSQPTASRPADALVLAPKPGSSPEPATSGSRSPKLPRTSRPSPPAAVPAMIERPLLRLPSEIESDGSSYEDHLRSPRPSTNLPEPARRSKPAAKQPVPKVERPVLRRPAEAEPASQQEDAPAVQKQRRPNAQAPGAAKQPAAAGKPSSKPGKPGKQASKRQRGSPALQAAAAAQVTPQPAAPISEAGTSSSATSSSRAAGKATASASAQPSTAQRTSSRPASPSGSRSAQSSSSIASRQPSSAKLSAASSPAQPRMPAPTPALPPVVRPAYRPPLTAQPLPEPPHIAVAKAEAAERRRQAKAEARSAGQQPKLSGAGAAAEPEGERSVQASTLGAAAQTPAQSPTAPAEGAAMPGTRPDSMRAPTEGAAPAARPERPQVVSPAPPLAAMPARREVRTEQPRQPLTPEGAAPAAGPERPQVVSPAPPLAARPARREVRAEPPRQPSTPEGRAAAARRARQQISHNTALRLLRTSAPVKMHVVYTNAGGAVLQSEGLEGFMPLMMMDAAHTAEVMLAERELLRDNPLPIAMDIREVQSQVLRRAMMVLLHREVTAYVYKVDLASYSIILSEQPPDQHESGTLLVPHEARHILLQNLRETVDTTVHRVMQAGAVLEFDVEVIRDDVQTIYGIVPREEVSWDATQSPGDVVQPGQSVRAKIIGVDLMRGRVFLSLKQTQQDPLLQSLDSFMQQQASVDAGSYDSGLQTKLGNLPEVDAICAALNSHPDIESAAAGRRLQGRASAPELQVFLARAMPNSSAPAEAPSTAASAASAQTGAALNQEDTQGGFPLAAALPGPQDAQEYELLARVGIDVQDIHVRSRLDREAMKAVLSGIVAALGPAS